MKIWQLSGMGEHFKHVLLAKEYKLKVSSFLFLELLIFWPSIRRNEHKLFGTPWLPGYIDLHHQYGISVAAT